MKVKDTLELESGLLIPASAGAAKVLTSDGSGNAAWAAPASDPLKANLAGPTFSGTLTSGNLLALGNNAAADPTPTSPAVVGTGTGGAAYPYLEAGNLVIGSRWSGAGRDILFYTGTTPVERLRVDRNGVVTIAGSLSAGNLQINGSSIGWHQPVRACSPAGVNITVASPGATIDGVTMAAADRVLLRDQTTASQNGIYVWNGAAVPMTRATDADTTGELVSGDIVTVTEGATRGFNKFQVATTGVITIGTTAIDFDPFNADSDYKRSVRAATTANIATILTAPGATIDGVTMAAGDRFLAKNQTTASENGIYTWASATACSRSGENNTQSKTGSGMLVWVEDGVVNKSTEYRLTTPDPVVPGTTALSFANMGFFTGMTVPYAGAATPDAVNWLLCDGTEKAAATYPALYALIGTSYGPITNGSGVAWTTGPVFFRLPDMRGRVPVGVGTAATSPLAGSTAPTGATAHTLGQSSGEETHQLVTGEAAQKAVTSTGRSVGHTHGAVGGGQGFLGTNMGTAGAVGSGVGFTYGPQTAGESADHTHNVAGSSAVSGHQTMQPYVGMNYLIKT